MPYVEGESLRQRLGADNRLSIEEAVRIGREVAGALAYAHERGVVHRDIKPENILFSGGHAVVADFGIARAIDRAHEKITQQGTITGTPAYMSPEQARDRAFDGRSDVYSLACVLYEAIAGVPPFAGRHAAGAARAARLTKTPPPLREFRHDVPAPIEPVIAKALAMSPDDRYADARAFSAALSAAIGHSGETITARAARRPLVAQPVGVGRRRRARRRSARARRRRRCATELELLTVRVDTAQFAVRPLPVRRGARRRRPAAEPAAAGVYDALKRWDGLQARERRERAGRAARPSAATTSLLEDAARVARTVRAGRVVWGRVRVARDSSVVRAGLYDALTRREPARGEPRRRRRRRDALRSAWTIARSSPTCCARRGSRAVSSTGGSRHDVVRRRGRRSSVARSRSRAGTWSGAIPALDSAVETDPSYPQANLWLAQAKSWRRSPPKEWTTAYIAADRGRAVLDAREQLLADALGAMSREDYPARVPQLRRAARSATRSTRWRGWGSRRARRTTAPWCARRPRRRDGRSAAATRRRGAR